MSSAMVDRICGFCKRAYQIQRLSLRKKRSAMCSLLCARRASRRPPEELFWALVARGGAQECWLWTGRVDRRGYGRAYFSGKRGVIAPRVAYCLANALALDSITEWCVLHSCDNPGCCNPKHLRLGTKRDNTRDMFERGRSGMTPISNADVRAIRRGHAEGRTFAQLAAEHNVGEPTIKRICQRKTWRHVA